MFPIVVIRRFGEGLGLKLGPIDELYLYPIFVFAYIFTLFLFLAWFPFFSVLSSFTQSSIDGNKQTNWKGEFGFTPHFET